jgi:ribosomal protein S12 methylthiotransferase accessory factor
MSEMRIDFSGGSKVRATHAGFTVETDQPLDRGGTGTAPGPFDLFLISIGTCAGTYVLEFLRRRGLPTDEVHLTLTTSKSAASNMLSEITLHVTVPEQFPDKYRQALVRAVDLCAVKRHLLDPPCVVTLVEPKRTLAAH